MCVHIFCFVAHLNRKALTLYRDALVNKDVA
jgi:hypothetical protein